MPDYFDKNISHYSGGMKWALVKYRQEIGEKVNEGKVPMPFEVYCLMCDLLVCGTHYEYLFFDCFITPN